MMFGQRCRHPVNELLPFYVNGSLGDEERRAADDHVRGCATCRDEGAALQGIAAAIRSEPQPILDDPPLRRSAGIWAALTVAAALALAWPAFALWRAARSAQDREQATAAPGEIPSPATPSVVADASTRPVGGAATIERAAYLDLKGGPTRGAVVPPRLAAGSAGDLVVIALTLPERPVDADRLVLADPQGRVVARSEAPLTVDAYGRVTLVIQRSIVRAPGTYHVSLLGAGGTAAGVPAAAWAFRVGSD
jgi:hypothetical protein